MSRNHLATAEIDESDQNKIENEFSANWRKIPQHFFDYIERKSFLCVFAMCYCKPPYVCMNLCCKIIRFYKIEIHSWLKNRKQTEEKVKFLRTTASDTSWDHFCLREFSIHSFLGFSSTLIIKMSACEQQHLPQRKC